MRSWQVLLLGALLASCSNATGLGLDDGGGSIDLAGADFAGADFAGGGTRDFSGVDLVGYSDVGGPCGGFIGNAKQCLPGLVCVSNGNPDAGGTCANPDAGACMPNGGTCAQNGDCCSGNCILRGNPGFCCIPGGCP